MNYDNENKLTQLCHGRTLECGLIISLDSSWHGKLNVVTTHTSMGMSSCSIVHALEGKKVSSLFGTRVVSSAPQPLTTHQKTKQKDILYLRCPQLMFGVYELRERFGYHGTLGNHILI